MILQILSAIIKLLFRSTSSILFYRIAGTSMMISCFKAPDWFLRQHPVAAFFGFISPPWKLPEAFSFCGIKCYCNSVTYRGKVDEGAVPSWPRLVGKILFHLEKKSSGNWNPSEKEHFSAHESFTRTIGCLRGLQNASNDELKTETVVLRVGNQAAKANPAAGNWDCNYFGC